MSHPKTRYRPTEIAPDTFLIHNHEGEGEAPVSVPLNTVLIRAAEPVVVDTGMKENRDDYFEDLFGLVEPEDIRWVFISHDDVDHTGNLNMLMERRSERHAARRLVHGDPHGRFPRGRSHEAALDRRRRQLLGRRPRAVRHPPADLRLADDARPVRPDDRLLLVLGQLRHADAHARP